MDNTEKKLNQILNLLNLTHNENTFMLEFIKNLFINEADRKAIEKYIEKCNVQKEAIISGLYEDDVKITSWYFLKEKNYQNFKRKKLSKRESKNKREKITEFYLSDNENKTKFCTSLKRSANMSVLFK